MKTYALLAALALQVTPLLSSAQDPNADWEPALRQQMQAMADNLAATLKPWNVPERYVKPEEFGAVADGETVNTRAIQRAVDLCSSRGGGVVLFAEGDYVTGTIDLKSGVMIEVAVGARILGSTNLADYPDRVPKRATVMDSNMKLKLSLFYAEGVERIGFRGHGEIDFRGSQTNFPGKQTATETPGRPFGIRVIDSRQIVVKDITLRDAACWMQNYLNCEDLIFQRMKVINQANHNNDGIDIDGCRRVIVRDCVINSEDDAMCIKGASLRPTEDVLIENSTFVTTCNALKIGTDTQGDFRRIYARNLKLGGIPDDMPTWKGRQASTGITLATVDGGDVEDILIEDCVIERSRCPIFLRIGSRGRLMPDMPPAKIGALRRIVIEDITGQGNFRQGSFISGIADGMIEDVVIRRVDLGMEGGGTAEMAAAEVKDNEKGYPDAHQFSVKGLPAHGFYLRHAQRVRFEDVRVTPSAADARPLIAVGPNTRDLLLDERPLVSPAVP
jgi:polygalacturonase